MHTHIHIYAHIHTHIQTNTRIIGDNTNSNLLCHPNLTHGIEADLVGVKRTLQVTLSNLATTRYVEACLLVESVWLNSRFPWLTVS